MKAKVNILAKPHPYIFFTLQSDSVFESYLHGSYLVATYEANIPSCTDTDAGSCSSFPGNVGGARKWPGNEATSSNVGELVASFPGNVGGARKWPENEATAMNCQ